MRGRCPVCGAEGNDLQTMRVEDTDGYEYEVHVECFDKEHDALCKRLHIPDTFRETGA